MMLADDLVRALERGGGAGGHGHCAQVSLSLNLGWRGLCAVALSHSSVSQDRGHDLAISEESPLARPMSFCDPALPHLRGARGGAAQCRVSHLRHARLLPQKKKMELSRHYSSTWELRRLAATYAFT